MLANTSRTDKRAAKVCSALVGHPGITPGGKLYRRSPQWNPCLLGRCSIAPRWEADAIPVSPLGASSLLALRLIVTSRVLHRGQANPACPVLDKSASILLGQHDRDHAFGDRRISWIGGVVAEALVVVVDLEQDRVAIGIEAAKIVLLVGIVGVTKVVKHGDGLDDPGDGFGAEGGDAGGHHCKALGKILTQFIVQRADARSLAVHDGPPDFWVEERFGLEQTPRASSLLALSGSVSFVGRRG